MNKFDSILASAEQRKGGSAQLARLLPAPLGADKLLKIPDHRYLAQMTRCVFNAGFHWRVITSKWPGFEEAFAGFELDKLLAKSPEEWEQYLKDERIVRNWQKIQTVFQNAEMIEAVAAEHGSFAKFFSNWPIQDQVGLMTFLKKNGARLGGQTCQYFIRFIGKDSFITSKDVITGLIANGVEISNNPTSQRDLQQIQQAFNAWQDETGLPMTHLSRILSFTVGENIPVEVLDQHQGESVDH